MIILDRLVTFRETQIRENQAGFRPGRGCVDHIFTLRRIMETRHSLKLPTLFVFLDLKATFDSVNRCLWDCLSKCGVPDKYVRLIQSICDHPTSRVRAYGELSPEFTTTSGVRQGCPLSLSLFNFVTEVLFEWALHEFHDSGIQLLSGERLTD